MATKHDGFKDFVLDQLADLRGLTCRAMSGGYGLRYREAFFGIVHKGRLYFKVSRTTITRYQDQRMKPFRPSAKQTLKSFYTIPADALGRSTQADRERGAVPHPLDDRPLGQVDRKFSHAAAGPQGLDVHTVPRSRHNPQFNTAPRARA